MGSSKSGSLDKLAAFSPAAALASGKVKLPETGIVGMLQAKQENKMNKGAQMAQQDDDEMAQYMQMMQQQSGMNMGGRVGLRSGGEPGTLDDADEHSFRMFDKPYRELNEFELEEFDEEMSRLSSKFMAAGGPVESMQFLKQHLPYQDGGHVALRRKMFKMGGPVNTHGIGITSGLEFRNNYNAGGQVRQNFSKAGIVKKILQLAKKVPGSKATGNQVKALKDAFGERGIKALSDYIKSPVNREALEALAGKAGPVAAAQAPGYLRMAGRTAGLAGTAAAPLAALSTPFGRLSEEERKTASDLSKGFDTARGGVEFLSSFNPALAGIDLAGMGADTLYEASQEDPNYLNTKSLPDMFRKYITGSQRGTDTPSGMDQTGVSSKTGMTLDDLKKQNQAENQARMQQAMEQYAELLAGSDNTNKLATLGDSLIAGGSALLDGQGYGAAGRAFNEPMSASRRSREERMAAANSSAAQLAISENMSIDAENRAVVNEFMKTGSFSDAEQAQLMALAQETGGARLIPENEDGEIDGNVVKQPGVYADPKNLSGKGTLFIAIDSDEVPIYTNDPKEAKAHAAG